MARFDLRAFWPGMVAAVACAVAVPAAAQVPPEILALSPDVRGLGADAAAKWRSVDLRDGEGGTLAGTNSYGIHAADFDRDGDLDLVVAFQSGGEKIPDEDREYGTVYWLENLAAPPDSGLAFRIHLLDDRQVTPKDAVVVRRTAGGSTAVVVPCYLSGETVIYETSDGERWTKLSLRSKALELPVRAVVADVDGDDLDDIVVTSISESGRKVGWFRQNSSESEPWEAMPIRVNLPPIIGVDAGDVDLDGDLDLVCASEYASRPFLLINTDGKGTDWKRDSIRVESPDSVRRWVARFSDKPLSQVHARFADLDGDGDLDCVETSLRNGYLAWRERLGSGKEWKFHKITGGLGHAYSFDIGDVDRDGRLDIVVPSEGGDGVYVFRNVRGDGTMWEATRLGEGEGLNWPNIVRLADLDGDGYDDVMSTDWGTRAVVWINPLAPIRRK
ncbi:MAG: VCBS repeat-containing protein [Gemmatimonadota bacterium]|nr:VCBS repeat-containing protein [Gemmatimonadota bacterium]